MPFDYGALLSGQPQRQAQPEPFDYGALLQQDQRQALAPAQSPAPSGGPGVGPFGGWGFDLADMVSKALAPFTIPGKMVDLGAFTGGLNPVGRAAFEARQLEQEEQGPTPPVPFAELRAAFRGALNPVGRAAAEALRQQQEANGQPTPEPATLADLQAVPSLGQVFTEEMDAGPARAVARFGIDLARDPLTFAGLGAVSKLGTAGPAIEKALAAAFAGEMARGTGQGIARAADEYGISGGQFTPESQEAATEAALSAAMTALGARGLAPRRPSTAPAPGQQAQAPAVAASVLAGMLRGRRSAGPEARAAAAPAVRSLFDPAKAENFARAQREAQPLDPGDLPAALAKIDPAARELARQEAAAALRAEQEQAAYLRPRDPEAIEPTPEMLQAVEQRPAIARPPAEPYVPVPKTLETLTPEQWAAELAQRQKASGKLSQDEVRRIRAFIQPESPPGKAYTDLGYAIDRRFKTVEEARAFLQGAEEAARKAAPAPAPVAAQEAAPALGRAPEPAAAAEPAPAGAPAPPAAPAPALEIQRAKVARAEIDAHLAAAAEDLALPMTPEQRRQFARSSSVEGLLPSASKKGIYGLERMSAEPQAIARAIQEKKGPLYEQARAEAERALREKKEAAEDAGVDEDASFDFGDNAPAYAVRRAPSSQAAFTFEDSSPAEVQQRRAYDAASRENAAALAQVEQQLAQERKGRPGPKRQERISELEREASERGLIARNAQAGPNVLTVGKRLRLVSEGFSTLAKTRAQWTDDAGQVLAEIPFDSASAAMAAMRDGALARQLKEKAAASYAVRQPAAARRAAELEQLRQQAQRMREETARPQQSQRDPGAAILDAMDRVKPLAQGGTGQAPSIGVPELWEATRGQFRDRAEFDHALLQLQRDGKIGTERGDTGLSPERFEASTVDPARPASRIMAAHKRGGEPSAAVGESTVTPGVTVEQPGLQLAAARRRFGALGKVTEEAGALRVKFRDGKADLVIRETGEIEIDPRGLAKHGLRELPEGSRIEGETRVIGPDVVVTLARGAGADILPHEELHAAMRAARFTDREVGALQRKYEAQAKQEGRAWEEIAAEDYGRQVSERIAAREKGGPVPVVQEWVRKLHDFFSRVWDTFTPSARAAFSRLERGDVYRRGAEAIAGDTAPRYALGEVPRKRGPGDDAPTQQKPPETPQGGGWIRDDSGQPRTLYHGTAAKFSKFDRSALGSHTGAKDAQEAFFFTDDKGAARHFAQDSAEIASERNRTAQERVIEANVRLQNPLVIGIDAAGSNVSAEVLRTIGDSNLATLRYARENGHDGVIWPNGNASDPGYVVAVFEPGQIRQIGAPKPKPLHALQPHEMTFDQFLKVSSHYLRKLSKTAPTPELREAAAKAAVHPSRSRDALYVGFRAYAAQEKIRQSEPIQPPQDRGGAPSFAVSKAAAPEPTSKRGARGVAERFLLSSTEALRAAGGSARELADRVLAHEEQARLGAAAPIRAVLQARARLFGEGKGPTPEEFSRVVDYLEGGRPPTNRKLRDYGDAIRKVLDDTYQQAVGAGLDVGKREGNYWPRQKDGAFDFDQAAADLAKEKGISRLEAEEQLAEVRSQTAGKGGDRTLAKERTDPRRAGQAGRAADYRRDEGVLTDYLVRAHERIAGAAQFDAPTGRRYGTLKDLLARIPDADTKKTARDLLERQLGMGREPTAGTRLVTEVRAANALRDLVLAPISQLSTAAQTAAEGGIARTARTFVKTLGRLGEAERESAAAIFGATQQALGEQIGQTSAQGPASRLASKAPWLKATQAVDKWQRVLADQVGRDFVREVHGRAREGKASAQELRDLQRLGVDPKKPVDAQLDRAAARFSDATQGNVSPAHIPGWMSSQLGKTVMQYTPFLYRVSALAGRWVAERDVPRIAKFLAASAVLGQGQLWLRQAATGVGVDDASDGEKWADAFRSRRIDIEKAPGKALVQSLLRAGSLGIAQVLMEGVMAPGRGGAERVAEFTGRTGQQLVDVIDEKAKLEKAKAEEGWPGVAREVAAFATAQAQPTYGGQISREFLRAPSTDAPAHPGWVGRFKDRGTAPPDDPGSKAPATDSVFATARYRKELGDLAEARDARTRSADELKAAGIRYEGPGSSPTEQKASARVAIERDKTIRALTEKRQALKERGDPPAEVAALRREAIRAGVDWSRLGLDAAGRDALEQQRWSLARQYEDAVKARDSAARNRVMREWKKRGFAVNYRAIAKGQLIEEGSR